MNCIDFHECESYNSFTGMQERILMHTVYKDKLFKVYFSYVKLFKIELK